MSDVLARRRVAPCVTSQDWADRINQRLGALEDAR